MEFNPFLTQNIGNEVKANPFWTKKKNRKGNATKIKLHFSAASIVNIIN
jgi:hypothetical protein